MNPAPWTNTFQLSISLAEFFTAASLVTSTSRVETCVLVLALETRDAVSFSVVKVRPMRIICFAPVVAKAMAVSRPIPEP